MLAPTRDEHPPTREERRDRAYIVVDTETLAARGLSEREIMVVALVAGGRTNAEVAKELGLSPFTVKKHLERIYAKTGIHGRVAIAAWVWENAPRRRP